MATISYVPKGMVNLRDPIEVRGENPHSRDLVFEEMTSIENMDIDDAGKASPRLGTYQIYPASVHSGWASGDICLFVESGVIKRLWPNESITIIHILGSDGPLRYAQTPDGIFCYSRTDQGIVRNGEWQNVAVFDVREFKTRLPLGQAVDFVGGRVVVGSGRSIFYTDAYSLLMDRRRCEIPLSSEVTMIQGLENSFYASDSAGVYWFNNTDPTTDGFTKIKVADEFALPGDSIKIQGKYLSSDTGLSGSVACWFSSRGFCFGDDQGHVVNASLNRIAPPQADEVSLTFRQKNGYYQIVAALRSVTAADNPFIKKPITITTIQL